MNLLLLLHQVGDVHARGATYWTNHHIFLIYGGWSKLRCQIEVVQHLLLHGVLWEGVGGI